MKKSKNVTNTLFIQRRSILILLIAISFCLQAFAQNKLVYNHFSTEDGLATSDVKCVAQDKQGFIWVATSSGLQKFDGNRFINPLENKGSSKALSIGVRQIIADSNGRFFLFMMNNEYALFDPMSLEFKYIRIKSLKEVPIKADYQLYKDSKGHIFMCANNYGLLMYDSKRNLYTDQNLPIQIPPAWTVNGLYEDVKNGNYWICSDTGLAVYNIVSRKLFYKGHNPEHIPLLDGNYRAMAFLIDKENRYWLTHWTLEKNYEEHVLYYDANTKRIVNRPNGSNLGDYAQVRSLMEDYNGTIWLGGFEVLLTLYPRQNNFIQNKDTGTGTNGIKFSIINNLFQDREKNIWVSSDKGLFIVYPKGSSISNFQFAQKNDIYVVSFSPEKENEIWVAAWGKGILFFDSTLNELKNNTGSLPKFIMWLYADKKTNIVWASYADGTIAWIDRLSKKVIRIFKLPIFNNWPISQIVEDADGNLWFATQPGRLIKWNRSKSFNEKDFQVVVEIPSGLQSLYVDHNNHLWVGTMEKGLLELNVRTNKLINQYYTGNSKNALSTNKISAVRQLNDSIYFISGYGLDILNIRSGTVRHFGFFEGLTGGFINCMELDSNHILWFGTISNFCSYNYRTNHLTVYNKSDGILNSELIRNITITNEGKMILGGVNSICILNPIVLNSSKLPPDVSITDFKILNQPVNIDSLLKLNRLTLPYNKSSFTISFASPTYSQKDKLTYYYKLEGADKEWIQADNAHLVNYSLLPSGRYTFMIRSENDQGVFSSHITQIPIYIRPPFWLTWWFISICVIITAVIINYIYKQRISQLLAVEKVRQRVARDLHDDMGSTLSTINILSLMAKNKINNDPVKVSEYIGKISDNSSRMMEAMDDIVWNINPVNDDIQKIIARMREFATNVLEAKEIELNFIISDAVNNVYLTMEQRRDLFLIFKESVNNVAKYSHCRRVIISLTIENKMMILKVKDDGIGFIPEEADSGNGLKNMRKRAEQLKGHILINSSPGNGSSICLKFQPV